MVSYQRWTAVAFEVARSKGMRSSQENSQALISLVADVWNRRKAELQTATIAEAQAIAREEVHVQAGP